MRNVSLFDTLGVEHGGYADWKPPQPPSLSGVRDIYLDTETTGLDWWHKARPIGIALKIPGGPKFYLPWGHSGGNLDESVVKRWAERELRGKRITNLNTKFDIHQMREWGIDLEAQDCTFSDVGHYAALLDDSRKKFNLEDLSQDFLGMGKIKGLDKTRMAEYHAGEVADYAMQDVELVDQLKEIMYPRMDAEDLQRVRQLEDEVIPVVCEMEKNAGRINVELLHEWTEEVKKRYEQGLLELAKECGFQVNPDSPTDQTRVFQKYGIPVTYTAANRPSFTAEIMKKVHHPTVQKMVRVGKMYDLLSKYLLPYTRSVGADGILRYSLHQLRTVKGEGDEGGEAGTTTGRFSSTAILKKVGINIQQIMKAEKQIPNYGPDFLIRQLHVPESGLFLSADAMQIEYRMMAHYANNPKVIQAYRDNPMMSFHRYMETMLRKEMESWTYKETKDLNFAYGYGAKMVKMAVMCKHITQAEADDIRANKRWKDPRLERIQTVLAIYQREMPEAEELIQRASHLAMDHCDKRCNKTPFSQELHRTLPHRGYVMTLDGRRGRFSENYRVHKGLNTVIQGGAASVMKRKLVELHNNRKWTNFKLRWTVHDEADGDIPDKEHAARVQKILNEQAFPELRVPILWELKTGRNWRECGDDWKEAA